jgi:hypothetical protein
LVRSRVSMMYSSVIRAAPALPEADSGIAARRQAGQYAPRAQSDRIVLAALSHARDPLVGPMPAVFPCHRGYLA